MKLRVLIVDDDPAVLQPFAAAVAAADDMQVVGQASTLAQGRRLLLNCRPDVLLIDLGLPDGDGTALIAEATLALPGCEAMVVTVFGDEAHVLAAIEAGATGYLLKDASPAEIVDQLRVLRAGGSPISAVIARQILRRSTASAQALRVEPALQASAEITLSPREREVLQLCAKGYSYEEIAPLLGVSRHTVTTFVKRTYRKLQVHSRTEAVYEARKRGWVDD